MLRRLSLFLALILGLSGLACAQSNTNLNNFGSAPVFKLNAVSDGQCFLYQASTQSWINSSTCGGSATPAFNVITPGTNTGTLNIGTGGTLGPIGSGTVIATTASSVGGTAASYACADGSNNFTVQTGLCAPIATGNVLGYFGAGSGPPVATNAFIISTGNALGLLYFPTTTTLSSGPSLTNGELIAGGASGPLSIGSLVNPNASTTNWAFGLNIMASYTGIDSTGVGFDSLINATTGNGDTCGGWSSCGQVLTGAQITAWGASACLGSGSAQTTGNGSTCIGYNAGVNIQGAGGGITAIGAFTCNTTTGTNDTCLGYSAGGTAMTTSSNDVIIADSVNCALSTNPTNNEFDLCTGSTFLVRITGGGTPSTSITTFAGTVKVPFLVSVGSTFTLGTGTGACATSSTLTGGAQAGSFLCTGTAGASTQVINLPTAPNGWSCSASDAGSGVAWAQSATAAASCTISGTLAVTSQKVTFSALAY